MSISISMKNTFYDKMDLKLFNFHVTIFTTSSFNIHLWHTLVNLISFVLRRRWKLLNLQFIFWWLCMTTYKLYGNNTWLGCGWPIPDDKTKYWWNIENNLTLFWMGLFKSHYRCGTFSLHRLPRIYRVYPDLSWRTSSIFTRNQQISVY